MRSLAYVCSTLVELYIVGAKLAVADDDDPPGRVARLSLSNGQVSFSPAGTDDWVSAVVNRPLTTGDKLWTDRDGRAELHVGSAAFRISAMTGFSFLNLTDRMIQVRLTEGTINFRVRRLGMTNRLRLIRRVWRFPLFGPAATTSTSTRPGTRPSSTSAMAREK